MKRIFNYFGILFVLAISLNGYSQDFGCNATVNASGEYIDVGSNADYYGTTLTIEARIKADTWRNNIHEGCVLSCASWSSGESGWDLRAADNGNLAFNFSNGGWNQVLTSDNPMLVDQWYHVAVTYDNGAVALYIDGAEVASGTQPATIDAANTGLYIGTCPDDLGRYFDGAIDEIRIWNTALDATTIATWYNQELDGSHPSYANIVAYYPFTNQNVTDASGNGNDGIITGSVEIGNCSETCADVLDIQVSNVTASTADITWAQGDAETNWNVIVSETVVTDFSAETPAAVTSTSYNPTGLSSATTYYVYVQSDCGGGDEGSWIASSFTTLVSCVAPTDLAAANITSSTADISWLAGASETEWNIIVSETQVTDFSAEAPVAVATTSYNATGLTAATQYYVYVQANCGAGDASSWTEIDFYTSCETVAVYPWTEEFEDWAAVTNCWDLSGGTQTVSQYNSNSVEASYWGWSSGNTAYLTSPDFDLTSLTTPAIEFFWSHNYSSSYPNDSLALQVSDDAGTTWATIWSKSGSELNSNDGAGNMAPGSYTSSGALDISTFGSNISFRFYFHSGYGPDCFVDNVSIYDNLCAYPTDLLIENVTGHEADFSWLAGADETAWNIIISETEVSDFTLETPIALTTNTYNASGLTPETDYYVYVQADCGGSTSNWVDGTFTTLVACPVPTDILIENISQTSADITWTAGSDETAWNVIVSETEVTDFAAETPVSVSSPLYNATGLNSDVQYYVYVQADCGAIDGSSSWGESTFTTLVACPVPTNILVENLTQTSADITWTAGYVETTWNILLSETPITDFAAETPVVVTANTFNATALNADTDYYFYVQADCGATDGTSTWADATFFTGYCTPNPSSTDGNGITNVTFGQVLIINNETTGNDGYGDFSDQIGDAAAGLPLNVDITFSTGYSYNTGIFVDWNNDLDFDDDGELVYEGESTSSNPTTLNASFVIPVATPMGNYRMRIFGADYSSPDPCYTGSYGALEDYTLQVADAPDCFPVTDLLIENVTATSADISWAAGASETNWNVLISETEITDFAAETPIAVTETSYVATLLSPETTYFVYVQADCGASDGTSYWVAGDFTTDIACPVITDLTVDNITATTADISWLAGDTETDWNIIVSETMITDFSAETPIAVTETSYQATGLTQSTQYYVYVQANCGVVDGNSQWETVTFTSTISCPAVSDLILEDVTFTSAMIIWTAGGSEENWNVLVSETEVTDFAAETPIAVTTNSYEATDLEPGTQYYVYVQSDCGDTEGNGNWVGPIVISDQSGRTCFYSNGNEYSNGSVGSYFEIPTNSSFDLVKSVTIEAWIKTPSPDQNQKIIGKTDGSSFTSGYMLGIDDGRLYPEVWDQDGGHYDMTDNPELYDTENGTIANNKWTHVAFTFEAGEQFKGYVNGHMVYSVDVPNVLIGTNSYDLILGAAPWDVNYFGLNGYVDDIRIWTSSLDSLMINQWMHKQVSEDHPRYTSLVANYTFESQSETHCIDAGPNSNNGLGTRINWEDAYYPYASYSDVFLNRVEGVWDAYTSNNFTILTVEDADITAENGIAYGDNGHDMTIIESTGLDVDYQYERQWRFENIQNNTFDMSFNFEGMNVAQFDSICIVVADDADFTQNVGYYTLELSGDIASIADFSITTDETFMLVGAYSDLGVDIVAPEIAEVLDANTCVEDAASWIAPTATATDDVDGDISDQIVVSYSIDGGLTFDATLEECRNHLAIESNQVVVAYNVADAAGNNAVEESATITSEICNANGELVNGVAFNVYPNPNNGQFKLAVELENAGDVEFEILNMLGQTILIDRVSNTSGFVKDVDLNGVNKGSYIISVRFNDSVVRETLIIQ